MVEALRQIKFELYGVFEISDDGTILYSRQKSAGADKFSFEKLPQIVGRNFYNEIAPFENREEFRRRVKQFIESGFPSKHFIFDCRVNGHNFPVKIMLVRVTDRAGDERAKLTIVDIRKI